LKSNFDATSYAGRFEFVAGWLCLDFTNTINYAGRYPNERLTSFDDLIGWGCLNGLIPLARGPQLSEEARSRPGESGAALENARALRKAIHRIITRATAGQIPERPDMATLNAAMEQSSTHLHIKYADQRFDFDWAAESSDFEQIVRPIVWSAVALLTSGHMKMVKQCQGKNCSWLFLDETRNHSRRWCDMARCGNRQKASRFYVRHRDVWG
jgi:predicted RNA-binding Zn ribbon-like protein